MELLEWDASAYDALPLPHVRWGRGVIDRLGLAGDETVVDLGCGTGRDAEGVLERLPRGRVVAVDGSRNMLEQARRRLAGCDRVELVHADLTRPLPPEVRGDAVMSVATFHWVPDHAGLFGRVAATLPAGARFEAEFGGRGNIAGFQAALQRAGGPAEGSSWTFDDEGATAAALEAAGFHDVDVRLVPDPVRLQRGGPLEAFLATVVMPAILRDLPADEGRALVLRTAEELPEPVVDYVRMQLTATR
ncbi:class I SAM-dependent methyltransferase [Amnibacterium endophyticum]|uniref:Class I SAM-dependent methyltransferase n=1 Tax=Amnibacterium endophyticum TaxID=2109337 RepID=A0ABW4LC74_9MICO